MSAWNDFVTASLLGTEKGGSIPALPATLEDALGPAEKLEHGERFLSHVGALALWRRAGRKPDRSEATLFAPAPVEEQPLINPASTACLRAMLGGTCAEVLPEWLGEVARLGRRVPPDMLPALLDRARQHRPERPLAMTVGGARIRWLAGCNPDWNFAADDSPEHWETGGREQRMAILRGWRASDPAGAREKLEAVWGSEPADVREAFLALLADNLCSEDEPFIERALDDRGKEVRARAAELLARVPASEFVARMTARADPLLSFKKGGLLARATLEVELPIEPDATGLRDGLDPKVFGPYAKEFGDRAKLLILVLSAVPLSHWTDRFGQPPPALLKAVVKHEFASAVATGWARATVRQHDSAWAEALLDASIKLPVGFVPWGQLFASLTPAMKVARLREAVRAGVISTKPDGQAWPALFTEYAATQDALPRDLSQELLAALRSVAVEASGLPWHLRQLATTLACKLPPAMLPSALDGWPEIAGGLPEFVSLLGFRRDALAALSQP